MTLACLVLPAGAARAQGDARPQSVNCERTGSHPDEIWEETEAHCLGLLEGIAERVGDTLHLKLTNGTTKTFEDVVDGCEPDAFKFDRCYRYRLRDYFRPSDTFAIDLSYTECGGFIVVGRRDGDELELETMPKYSPRGSRLASVNASELCRRPYDIGIWSATAPFGLEWKYSTPQDGNYETWQFIRWEGDDRLKLRAEVSDGKGGADSFDTEAVRTPQGWDLKRPWALK